MGLLTRSVARDEVRRQVRVTTVVRTAWGAALLLMPERLLRTAGGAPIPDAAVAVVRVLGLRHLLQAGVAAAVPTGSVAGLGALVDAAHASSLVGIAAWPRWRRAALLDLVVESAFVAAGWSAARRSQ